MKKIISCLIMMTMLVSMVSVFGVSAESSTYTVTTGDILKVPTDIEIRKNGETEWKNEYFERLPVSGGTTDTKVDLKATLEMGTVRLVIDYVKTKNNFNAYKDYGWLYADITVIAEVPKGILSEATKNEAVWGGAAETADAPTPDPTKTIYDEISRTFTAATGDETHDKLEIKLESKVKLETLAIDVEKPVPELLSDITLTFEDMDLGTIRLAQGETVEKVFKGIIQCDTYIYGPVGSEDSNAVKTKMENDTGRTQHDRNYFFRSIQKVGGDDPYTSGKDPVNNEEIISATAKFTTEPKQSTGQGGTTIKYTLKYESNGGTEYDDEKYNKGTVVDINKLPKKEGYVFEGWYIDPELTQPVDSVTMNQNHTVYASWVEDNGSAGNGSPTPDSLNGDDHFAYIVGYPDGNVRPSANITRAEVATIFFRLLKDAIRDGNLQYENGYNDVIVGDWFNCAISTMTKLGIVNGRLADEFAPNADITRAEFATICARFDNTEYEATDVFTDVSGHWAEEYIKEAAARGWIRGYEDGSFKPDQLIKRSEAMTMVNRVLNRIPETKEDLLDDMIKWPDNSDVNEWYYLAVQEATNSHLYNKKNRVYEKWTEMREARDWTTYEK